MISDFRVTVKWKGHELEVEGSATPYRPAVMYLSNGDPGYPAEGGVDELSEIYLVRGKKTRRLPDAMQNKLCDDYKFLDAVEDALIDYCEDAKADAAEYKAESWKDAKEMATDIAFKILGTKKENK